MRRVVLVPILLLAALAGAAPPKVRIIGATRVFLLSGDAPPASAEAGAPLDGPAPTVPASAAKGATAYFVSPDGSVVARSWKDLAADGTVDFARPTHLARVTIEARRAEAPLGGAVIEVKDADRTQRALTTNEGRATFAFVRIGEATVTGRVRGEGNETESRSLTVKIAASEPPTYRLEFAGAPAVSPRAEVRDRPTGAGVGSNLVSIVLGLIVVAAVAYGLWRFARERPEVAESLLKRIGADVPAPPEPAPAPVPAADPVPEPPATIVLDPVAPISLAGGAVASLIGADGSAFSIPEGETIVGREAIGGLLVAHESVSRRHARLVRSGDRVEVEDLGSTNGVFLDGARLSAPTVLAPGSRLRFGAVEFDARG